MKKQRHTVTIQGPGVLITGCFGADACPHRTQDAPKLPRAVADALGVPREEDGAKPSPPAMGHKTLKIFISYCPNACARSQIADVGLIGAARPVVSPDMCTACGACEDTCREDAVIMTDGGTIVGIDRDTCVNCGACAKVCPEGAITIAERGFRLMLGGKLGRHPRFADELPGLYTAEELPALAARAVAFYHSNKKPGERMGDTVSRLGAEAFIAEDAH